MITEMAKTTAQDLKDLSKAQSHANWSVFGFIIPFVGLILAGMAFSFLKVIPLNKDTELRIQQVKKTAYLGIVVSIIAMLFWGGFYKYNSWQNQKEQATIQSIKSKKIIKEQTENTYKNDFLRECLIARNGNNSECECVLNYVITNYDVTNSSEFPFLETYKKIFNSSNATNVIEFDTKLRCS